jgi:hypothetical protein
MSIEAIVVVARIAFKDGSEINYRQSMRDCGDCSRCTRISPPANIFHRLDQINLANEIILMR